MFISEFGFFTGLIFAYIFFKTIFGKKSKISKYNEFIKDYEKFIKENERYQNGFSDILPSCHVDTLKWAVDNNLMSPGEKREVIKKIKELDCNDEWICGKINYTINK